MLLVSHGIIKRLISMKTGISLVLESDIGVAADLDGPIQALLENAVAQPVHLGEIVGRIPRVFPPCQGAIRPGEECAPCGRRSQRRFRSIQWKGRIQLCPQTARNWQQQVRRSPSAHPREHRARIGCSPRSDRFVAPAGRPAGSGRCPQHGWTGRRQKPDATLNTSGSRAVQ